MAKKRGRPTKTTVEPEDRHVTKRFGVQIPEPFGAVVRILAAIGDRKLSKEIQIAIRDRAESVLGRPIPEAVIDEILSLKEPDQKAVLYVLEKHGFWSRKPKKNGH